VDPSSRLPARNRNGDLLREKDEHGSHLRRLSDIAVDLERIQAVLGSIRLAPFAASVARTPKTSQDIK